MHFLPHYTSQLWPPAASSMASEIDAIFVVWCVALFFLVAPVFVFMTYCSVRYRAGRPANREHKEARNVWLEMTWVIVPAIVSLGFFFWAGVIYLQEQNPPPNAMQITAMGRQWMWKFQHPGGQWEINDLHVPVGVPIRVNIFSQDVVHSLYIPALRLQEEAVPGRTTLLWFKADRVGAYNLYCSELCGAEHALMAGILYVMSPGDYQKWLNQNGAEQTLAAAGKPLFESYGCSGCHGPSSTVHAPSLVGLYGQVVPLSNGSVIRADRAYIQDHILYPDKQLPAGYKNIMPSYAGKIPDADLQKLVAYVDSLGPESP
jgi:cytochrome c oxidase subunit 2